MLTSAPLCQTARFAATLAVSLAALSAHADNLNPILGGGLGAMAGAFIGQSVGGRDGALIGAAVGGVAGVSIASNGERHHQEPVRTVVYPEPVRPYPVYGYRVVERVNYYPAPEYSRHGWGEHGHGHGFDERHWGPREEYRHGGEYRGWDRRD